MIALPEVTIQSQIYESSAFLVYQGVKVQDDCALPSVHACVCVVKRLKQDLSSAQELACGGN